MNRSDTGRKSKVRRSASLLTLACAAMLAIPAAASAADRYVDETGVDAGTCQTLTSPCRTINYALSQAGATETVKVDSGTYSEQIDMPRGKSLVAEDFDGALEPTPTIAWSLSNNLATIRVLPSAETAVGTIRGFILRGVNGTLEIFDSVVIEDNVLNNSDAPNAAGAQSEIWVFGGVTGGGTVIRNNTLQDPTPTEFHRGIYFHYSGSSVLLTIEGNHFIGLSTAIETAAGHTTISDNRIQGLHEAASPADPTIQVDGFGIVVSEAPAVISRNVIYAKGTGEAYGIFTVDSNDAANPTSAVLSRNQIYNQTYGIESFNTNLQLNSDVIANNSARGVRAFDGSDTDGTISQAVITNATIYNNGADLWVSGLELELDSSILGNPIQTSSPTTMCTINDSRGPAIAPGGNGCGQFETTADPQFLNPSPAVNDFRLAATSPLIDAGNPAPPPPPPAPNATDLEGDTRAMDGDCDGVAVRDMGADEVQPDCIPPDTLIDSGPNGSTADSTPTFTFDSTESPSTFECSIDSTTAFTPCSGPAGSHTTAPLAPGVHVFRVRAKDSAGNADQTPAERTFTVTGPPTATCKGRRATRQGTARAETLIGTAGPDVIAALGGNDTVKGLGGNDIVCAGAGVDVVRGGGGRDMLLGQGGNDRLFGDKGADTARGGAGLDTTAGGDGADRLFGNGARDRLIGSSGNDTLRGGAGPDILLGGLGRDRLFGGPGRDELDAGPGDDFNEIQ